MSDIIRMIKVEEGENKYHLIFHGYIPAKAPNYIYKFNFTGTDLRIDTYLPDEAKQQLKEQLCKDFGYAFYEINEVKKIFGKAKEYYVDSISGI